MTLFQQAHSLSFPSPFFSKTQAALRSAVEAKVAPGFVAGFWSAREPRSFYIEAFGSRRLEPSVQPLFADTVFDLASVSKVYGTAALAARLVDRGWIRWDTELRELLPEYRETPIRLHHLLSHTAGFAAWEPFFSKMAQSFAPRALAKSSIPARQRRMRELIFSQGLERPMGERAVYSDLSFMNLGFALEEACGLPLDQAVRRFVWEPLGVESSHYFRVKSIALRPRVEVAATEKCEWRGGILQGVVHDENCWAMGGYGGHAGAFGTARDLLIFSRGLMSGFLQSSTLERMWKRAEVPPGCERTYGWDTPSREGSSVGALFSASTVGHLGYSGTSLWIDAEAGLAVALLSNRVHPTRENKAIKAFRPAFHTVFREEFNRYKNG